MEIVSKKNTILNKEKIKSFLILVDDDFIPKLSSRINLENYINKIIKNAEIIACVDLDKIIGMIAYYCNEKISRKAYITFLAVHKDCRGKGIANLLLNNALLDIEVKQFYEVEVETWETNKNVISLYIKYGFEINEILDDREISRSVKMKKIIKR